LPDLLAKPTVLPKKLKSAFEDPTLVGGGVRALDRKLYKRLKYCSNLRKKNGKFMCGRLLAEGDHELTHCTNCGCAVSSFVDHVIELNELYPLLMRNSGLLQRIADYYPTSIERLSQPPDDPNARVWCTESGLVARTDYAENPVNFTLDFIPKLDEVALCEKDGKLIHCKVIECVNAERDKGFYRIRLENGEEHLILNKDCSRVRKIGDLVPVNISTMSVGAEVFKSSSMNYSNHACVEIGQSLSASWVSPAEDATIRTLTREQSSTRSNGGSWPNTELCVQEQCPASMLDGQSLLTMLRSCGTNFIKR